MHTHTYIRRRYVANLSETFSEHEINHLLFYLCFFVTTVSSLYVKLVYSKNNNLFSFADTTNLYREPTVCIDLDSVTGLGNKINLICQAW